MERKEIVSKLEKVFRTTFNDNSLSISDELTANDIDKWDSLTHMILISEIENMFSIKFKLKELNKMRKVGDMIEMINSKL